mmetsp:Transcript_52166/g.108630  ORF Transcript_52166/g.108630 Transcript_52166/m.108630 type:complete len:144 (-) Transcript_52166:523-954(-)
MAWITTATQVGATSSVSAMLTQAAAGGSKIASIRLKTRNAACKPANFTARFNGRVTATGVSSRPATRVILCNSRKHLQRAAIEMVLSRMKHNQVNPAKANGAVHPAVVNDVQNRGMAQMRVRRKQHFLPHFNFDVYLVLTHNF